MESLHNRFSTWPVRALAHACGGYDRAIRQVCPDYDEMRVCVADALPEDAESVVDLGCGTGALLALVRRARPSLKRLVGVDLDGACLATASEAVPRVGACTVDFVEADIRALELPPADCYTASLVLQALEPIAQAGLYARLARATPRLVQYAAIAPDGAAEVSERRAYLEWWLNEQGVDPAQGRDALARFVREGHLLTLREHRELCTSVGYSFTVVRRSPSEAVFAAWR